MNTVERLKRILNKEDHLLQESAPFTKFKNKENAEKRSGKASITETGQSIGHFIKIKYIFIRIF